MAAFVKKTLSSFNTFSVFKKINGSYLTSSSWICTSRPMYSSSQQHNNETIYTEQHDQLRASLKQVTNLQWFQVLKAEGLYGLSRNISRNEYAGVHIRKI